MWIWKCYALDTSIIAMKPSPCTSVIDTLRTPQKSARTFASQTQNINLSFMIVPAKEGPFKKLVSWDSFHWTQLCKHCSLCPKEPACISVNSSPYVIYVMLVLMGYRMQQLLGEEDFHPNFKAWPDKFKKGPWLGSA